MVALTNQEEVASLLKRLESEGSGNRKHRTNAIGQLGKKTILNLCDGDETAAREVSLRRGQHHSIVDELSPKRSEAGQANRVREPEAAKEGANDRNHNSKSNAAVAQLRSNNNSRPGWPFAGANVVVSQLCPLPIS